MKTTFCLLREKSDERGFTLVELLVVIAIIGVLIALLLPAIQAAREAARRTECGNKIKQISLSVHNFHDTFHRFPCMAADPIISGKGWDRGGWMIMILPFVEQAQVFDRIMIGQTPEDVAAGQSQPFGFLAGHVKIPTFLCPSDSGTSMWKAGDFCPTNYRGSRADLSSTSTEGNGDNSFPRSWLANGPRWGTLGDCPGGTLKGFEAVTDGTSNSVMLSEGLVYDRDEAKYGGNYKNHMAVIDWTTLMTHHQGAPQVCLNLKQALINGTQETFADSVYWHNLGTNALDHFLCHNSFSTLLPPNSPTCTNLDYWSAWPGNAFISASSNHPGGVQVSFLDASCRFITDSIRTQNLHRGSTAHGAVPEDGTGAFSYGLWSELGSICGNEQTDLSTL